MTYYSREERETIYRYDVIDQRWYISSSHTPHINRILERCDIKHMEKDDDGRVIYVEAEAEANQVRLFTKQ